MHSKTSFSIGLAAGLALAATTAFAAQLLPWSRAALDDANQLFANRSGLRFTANPPDPDTGAANPPDPDRLVVHAHPRDGLTQVMSISAANPPDPDDSPPDPCFRAVLANPPDPDRPSVVLHVLHADQFAIVDATGAALTLVPADGTVSTGTVGEPAPDPTR